MTRTVGFEIDLQALEPIFEAMLAGDPLFPASLGNGTLSNDLISIRLRDGNNQPIFRSGGANDPALTTYTSFGDTYSGAFEGLTC